MKPRAKQSPALPEITSPEAFFTRAKANEGVKLDLTLPDGTPTSHWIRIRGVDSDAFRSADNEARRRAMDLVEITDKAELERVMGEQTLELLAALVIDWSFDRPCVKESVVGFLREAPQIGEQINRLAARRSLFFRKGSANSSPLPAPSSS
jgi:hypothetical protein